ARSALPCGSRKLRAKPSRTFTTSPIWPSLATRSSRITCMAGSSLHGIGQQGEEAGALDGPGQFALLLRRDGGDTGGDDLAALGDIALQQTHVLVVDGGRVLARERADLAAAEKRFGGHGGLLL